MKLLLDTHALLWLTENSPFLSPVARDAITDPVNTTFFSVVSLWEISIKVGLGKLKTKRPLRSMFTELENRALEMRLPILTPHLLEYASLPLHHRDPFDRMILAQALSEGSTIVGKDPAFDAYGVRRIW
jgi:PIN domain nuclease of toxin-antitoxin system